MGKASRRRAPKTRFDIDDFEPIRIEPAGGDEEADGAVEQIHAFSIGDKDYYVPTQVPFHHSVKAMEIMAARGEAAAITYTMRTVLGDEAYTALIEFEGLQEEQFEAILKLANQIVNAGSGKAQ